MRVQPVNKLSFHLRTVTSLRLVFPHRFCPTPWTSILACLQTFIWMVANTLPVQTCITTAIMFFHCQHAPALFFRPCEQHQAPDPSLIAPYLVPEFASSIHFDRATRSVLYPHSFRIKALVNGLEPN